jgi:uncharacterized protein
VEFNKRAKLDTSQIQDARGSGGGVSRGGGLALGGGGLGVLGLVVALVINLMGGGSGAGGLSSALNNLQPGQSVDPAGNAELQPASGTGADAMERQDCRIVAVVNSVQTVWTKIFKERGDVYLNADTRFFSGGTNTGCGSASSAMGPFYCPADKTVYIDLSFYEELTTKFGAQGGDFAEAYVIAHEYGHHVSNILGAMAQVGRETGADSGSVRLELQADCYAGVWAYNATRTPDPLTGEVLITAISDDDIREGLDAAAAVGDDYIQEKFQGNVTPDTWTHGSSAQRQRWFKEGFRAGDPAVCDTFNASNLG